MRCRRTVSRNTGRTRNIRVARCLRKINRASFWQVGNHRRQPEKPPFWPEGRTPKTRLLAPKIDAIQQREMFAKKQGEGLARSDRVLAEIYADSGAPNYD